MQALRLILLPGIRIPCQEPSPFRLVIIAEGIIFVDFSNLSIPIYQLHHVLFNQIELLIIQFVFYTVKFTI